MKIQKIPSEPVLIGGGVLLLVLVAVWLTRRGNAASVGASVGVAAVDLVTGVVGGVAGGVAGVANDASINPLEPFGAWLGGSVYDLSHSKANGGVW